MEEELERAPELIGVSVSGNINATLRSDIGWLVIDKKQAVKNVWSYEKGENASGQERESLRSDSTGIKHV